MPTSWTFKHKNPAVRLSYSQHMAALADTNIFVAPKGTVADPFDLEKWWLLGVINGDSTENPNLQGFEVMTGAVRTRKATLKVQQANTLTINMTHLTMLGMRMAYANSFLPSFSDGITAALDGQTTVSSTSSYFSTTLASAANLAPGDMCIVQNSVNGADKYDEWVYIETVSGNTVTHSAVSQRPTASTPFKKVTKVQFKTGGSSFPEMEWLVVRFLQPGKQVLLQHRPSGQIANSDGLNFSFDNPMSVNATVNFNDNKDTDDVDYGNDYLMPLES